MQQPWRRPELTWLLRLWTSCRRCLRFWLRSLWWTDSNLHWNTLWRSDMKSSSVQVFSDVAYSRLWFRLSINNAVKITAHFFAPRFWQSPIRPILVSCGGTLMSSTCCWTSSYRTTSCHTAVPPSLRTSTAWKECPAGGELLFTSAFTGSHTGDPSCCCAWCRTCGPSWRPRWQSRGTRRTFPSS